MLLSDSYNQLMVRVRVSCARRLVISLPDTTTTTTTITTWSIFQSHRSPFVAYLRSFLP